MFRKIFCFFFGHNEISDDKGPYGAYGTKCSRCGHIDFHIHDM